MTNLSKWFSMVSNNDIRAYNKVSSRGLAICLNFIQIPDTDSVVVTFAVMKNRIKKNSLDPQSFARILSIIEEGLMEVYWDSDNREGFQDEYFRNLKSDLADKWYIKLACHRVFFIPADSLFEVIKNLFSQDKVSHIKATGIEEITVFVNTENYDFNAKFY